MDSKDGENSRLLGQLAALQAKRFMKLLAIVQDLADTVLAMNDIRGAQLLVLYIDCSEVCLQMLSLGGRGGGDIEDRGF